MCQNVSDEVFTNFSYTKCGNNNDTNPTAASKNLLGSKKGKGNKVWKTIRPSNAFISLSYSNFRDVIRGVYKKRREEKILHLTLAHLIINRTLALQVPSDWKADMTQTSASLRRQMWRPSVTERQARHQYAVPVHINGKTQLLLVGEDPSQQTLRALKTVCGQTPLHHSRKGDEPSLCY